MFPSRLILVVRLQLYVYRVAAQVRRRNASRKFLFCALLTHVCVMTSSIYFYTSVSIGLMLLAVKLIPSAT